MEEALGCDVAAFGRDVRRARVAVARGIEQVEDVGPEGQVLLAEGVEGLEEGHVDALVAWPVDLTTRATDVLECRSSRDCVRNKVVPGLAVGILGCGVGDIACLGVGEGAGVVPVLHGASPGGAGDPGVCGVWRASALAGIADADGVVGAGPAGSGDVVRTDGHRLAGLSAEDQAGRPTTDDVVRQSAVVEVAATTAEGQLVVTVEGEALTHIEGRVPVVGSQAKDIEASISDIVGTAERCRGVVERVRPGVGSEVAQAFEGAALEFGLKCVVARVGIVGGEGESSEVRVGLQRIDLISTRVDVAAESIGRQGYLTVGVREGLQMAAQRTYIRDCRGSAVSDAILDGQVELLAVRSTDPCFAATQGGLLNGVLQAGSDGIGESPFERETVGDA